MIRVRLVVGCLGLAAVPLLAAAAAADDSWKKPLSVKEWEIEQGIRKRHNIRGLYPSMVEIPPDGGPLDITTTCPFADIQHAVCWTANYLAGLSYKYAYLKGSGAAESELRNAKQRVDEVFEAVYRCQRVTGVRGLQARGYLVGHGETYAERRQSSKLAFWRQGQVDGKPFRWVGDPSHHNYSDAIHGLGQYYTLAAEGPQKHRAREAIAALVGYWVDSELEIAKYDRTLPRVPILGLTDGRTLNTRVMMAIAGAKVAHFATGKAKYAEVYKRLVNQYGVRGLQAFRTGKDFDDAEHVFCHLDLLFRIETDPQLLAAFRKVADGLWANHCHDAQSLFTYIYYHLAPDADGREQALEEALRSLRTWPTDMMVKPRMNSLNPEIRAPYPTHLAAWDNEYIWKSGLLRADGWLSRIVVDVAVSPEDAAVVYAVDEAGGLYQSRDGAASWQGWRPIDQKLRCRVRSVDVGRRSRILAVATDDGFFLSETGGANWQRLPVPSEVGSAVDIFFDPGNPHVLFAIGATGACRNRDFGEEYLGQSWQSLTADLPPLDRPQFVVCPGKHGRVYARSGLRLFTRTLVDSEWQRCANLGFGQYGKLYPWLAVDPTNADRVLAGASIRYGQMGPLSILQESSDAGQNWSLTLQSAVERIRDKGFAALAQLAIPGELNHLTIDPCDPATLYAAGARGARVSIDGGKSWSDASRGLAIPLVKSLTRPRNGHGLFAATPAGLYMSCDRGLTWTDTNLWLQFEKNTRRELGGAGFIDAYWRGRYFGLIDDAEASAPVDAWQSAGSPQPADVFYGEHILQGMQPIRAPVREGNPFPVIF